MLKRMWRNAVCGEQPVRVARTRAIEPQLDRRSCEPSHHTGLEIDLQIDDQVEGVLGQLLPDVGKRGPSLRSIEDENFVNRPVTSHERRGCRVAGPR
jgi:hypothetical protein